MPCSRFRSGRWCRTDFQTTWPAAYRFLKQYQIHNDEQQKMMDLIDNQGQDLDKVTQDWVDSHEDIWQPWVDAAMAGS